MITFVLAAAVLVTALCAAVALDGATTEASPSVRDWPSALAFLREGDVLMVTRLDPLGPLSAARAIRVTG